MSFLDEVKNAANNKFSFTLADKEKCENIAIEAIADFYYEEIKKEILEKIKSSSSKNISGIYKATNFYKTMDEGFTVSASLTCMEIRIPCTTPPVQLEQLKSAGVTYQKSRWGNSHFLYFETSYGRVKTESGGFLLRRYTATLPFIAEQIVQKVQKKAIKDGICLEAVFGFNEYRGKDYEGYREYSSTRYVKKGFSFTNKNDNIWLYGFDYKYSY